MNYPHILHLILTATGLVCSEIHTVTKVSVKARGSVIIPCLYEPAHTDQVKYLCDGYFWLVCSIKVKTDQPHFSGQFSISDDTNQNIFTVTIHNLTYKDYNFWCAVDSPKVVRQHFQLSVTEGLPSVYVARQKVAAFAGGSVTVMCHYKYMKVLEWCRLGSSCVTDPTGSLDGTNVSINASVPNIFNVTMSDLRTENSGWYLCTNGYFQMPVHVTVHELTTMITSTSATRTLSATRHSSLYTEPVTATKSTMNSGGEESLQDEQKISTKVTVLVTVLVLQLLLVPAAFFGWRMIRQRKTKPEGSDITEGSQAGSGPDVIYSTIVHNLRPAASAKQNHIPEESVIYSTIVIKDGVQRMIEPADGNVIYSTLRPKI